MSQLSDTFTINTPQTPAAASALVAHASQNSYFMSGATRTYEARRLTLLKLRAALRKHEPLLLEALQKDLRKHPHESYMTEIGFIYDELHHVIQGLKSWMKPRKVSTPLSLQPGSSMIIPEALGRVLVIAPWNYPLQLAINPVIGALAAGNVVTLKPSELTPHVSAAIALMVRESFEPALFHIVEGGVDVSECLLAEKWDHIFFTGSTAVGKIVAVAAAKQLAPVTLELGGKSPCIVTKSANIELAARRIVFGKVLNAGQTCVAPDYLLVEKGAEQDLIKAMRREIELRYGSNPLENPDMPRIVSDRHFQRLTKLMDPKYIVAGGRTDASQLLIEPTLFLNFPIDHPLMQEELFGPLLPILTYDKIEDAIRLITERDHPLALYIFSEDKDEQESVIRGTRFGGGAINDTIMHLANANLPFGGVGASGHGNYHGVSSFECFVHHKSVLKTSTFIDLPFRYAPWTPLKNKLIRLFLR